MKYLCLHPLILTTLTLLCVFKVFPSPKVNCKHDQFRKDNYCYSGFYVTKNQEMDIIMFQKQLDLFYIIDEMTVDEFDDRPYCSLDPYRSAICKDFQHVLPNMCLCQHQ
jgi:hypothetical protein